jgi:hypothetical protein
MMFSVRRSLELLYGSDSDGHTNTIAKTSSDGGSENTSAARGVHSHSAVVLLIQKRFLDATHY